MQGLTKNPNLSELYHNLSAANRIFIEMLEKFTPIKGNILEQTTENL